MDLLLIGTAVAIGMAGFYVAMASQAFMGRSRRILRARTLDEQRPDRVSAVLASLETGGRWQRGLKATRDRTEQELERAGWSITVGEYLFTRFFSALLVGLLSFLITDMLA